jgi:glyoxylase-like metal-dependent hydrolase (beta-lactamase superfamily II)
LAKYGFTKDDITDVFLTHLHFDHCGGSIKREGDKLVPNFPNATFWSNNEHWEWATEPNEREKSFFSKRKYFTDRRSGKLKFIKRH